MQYDLMVVIFKISLHTWPWQKCVLVPTNIIGYRTGNFRNDVMISAQVLSYLVRMKIKIQQTCVQQYYFMLTVMFHVVISTGEVHTTKEQHVHCVPH